MAKKDEITPEVVETAETVEIAETSATQAENSAQVAQAVPAAPVTQVENEAPSLKPTAVASGSGLIAETAGAVELASPHIEPPLERVESLAAQHRVPAWQAAALNRFMGWEPGKLVPDAEYQTALASLNARRLGGGRKE